MADSDNEQQASEAEDAAESLQAVAPKAMRKVQRLDDALAYASEGMWVYPTHTPRNGECSCSKGPKCEHPGKHPRTAHGVADATTDPDTIRDWWKTWPRANIAIACGPSGIVVVDVDPRNRGDESFKRLQELFGTDWTATQRAESGGDGDHLYFQAVPGLDIRTTTDLVVDGVAYPGIDVKALGGGITAPPSLHASGKRYKWLTDESVPMLSAPSWLAGSKVAEKSPRSPTTAGQLDIPEGRRNSTLASMAGRWWKSGLPAPEVLTLAREANSTRCKPPMDEQEVEKIVESITSYEQPSHGAVQAVPSTSQRFKLLTMTELRDLPQPKPLVAGVLTVGGVSIVVGEPNVGKSFIAVDLSLSLSAGRDWAGRAVTKCPIVYISGEGRGGFPKRMQAWQDLHGAVPANMARILLEPVSLLKQEDLSDILRAINELRDPPGLIVFDTLSRSMGGADENSAADASLFIQRCDILKRETGAAICLIHHPGKSAGSKYRGSSVFEGAVDTMIIVESVDNSGGSNRVKLSCFKQKDMAKFDDLFFDRVEHGDSCVMVHLEDFQATDIGQSFNADLVLAALLAMPSGKATSGEWLAASKMPQTTFHRSRNALLKKGWVAKEVGARGRYYATGVYSKASGM